MADAKGDLRVRHSHGAPDVHVEAAEAVTCAARSRGHFLHGRHNARSQSPCERFGGNGLLGIFRRRQVPWRVWVPPLQPKFVDLEAIGQGGMDVGVFEGAFVGGGMPKLKGVCFRANKSGIPFGTGIDAQPDNFVGARADHGFE